MMKSTAVLAVAVSGVILLLMGWSSAASAPSVPLQDNGTEIAPRADRILRQMSEYLQTAGEFTFRADITYDSMQSGGEEIQYGGVAKAVVRRPDRLHVEFNGDERHNQILYDGGTFTLFDVAAGLYAVTEVPSTLDAAVDLIFEKYGFSVPIADFVYADPYQTLMENAESGFVVGMHSVDGVPSHHLYFRQDSIDWQIWIEDGPRPVPRKLLITYKNEPESRQYTARLSGWDFQPRVSEHYFEFVPPDGASEMEFLPTQDTETESRR